MCFSIFSSSSKRQSQRTAHAQTYYPSARPVSAERLARWNSVNSTNGNGKVRSSMEKEEGKGVEVVTREVDGRREE